LRYIPHTESDVLQMLETIGAPSVESLFECIPDSLRLKRRLELPPALSEQELIEELGALAAKNAHSESHDWFLGAGTYAHFIPSVVDTLLSRGEFLTAYTPYQPELSQGTLQAIFEWQTMMSSLAGVEVTNASMYDGASAAAESALMAMRITQRSKIVVAPGLHPHYRSVIETITSGLRPELVFLEDGASLEAAVDAETAAVLVQRPDFFGRVRDLSPLARIAHDSGALMVAVVTEALSLGLLAAPGHQGADIVCGEAQSFGVPMGLGGPHVGFLATQKKHVRQLPGRLAGETVDARGRCGYVLTLSTREQHIRRERATSNICTNQGLCLLRATIYLSLLGRTGLRQLAEMNLAKAEYAKSRVRETPGIDLADDTPTFNEFAVRVADSGEQALRRALEAGCVGGLDLAPVFPDREKQVLVCTTELTPGKAIDRLVAALAGASS